MNASKSFGREIAAVVALAGLALLGGRDRSAANARLAPQSGALSKQLIGAWRVMSLDSRPDGKSAWKPDYGPHPTGYIQYDANGRMSVQFCGDPPAKKFASGDDLKPTLDEAKEVYLNYVAYFGTYTVDEQKSVVTHHVQGSLLPGYNGTDQLRPFMLDGDRLTIAGKDADGWEWRRVFQRIK